MWEPSENPPSPERDFERWRRDADSAALGRVFDRLAPELLLVAAHIADGSAAEDLVQTTFLHAIDRAQRWDQNRPLLPWLIGILVKLSLREKAAARRELDHDRLTLASVKDPESEAERLELAQAVATALAGLPVHYRQVLTLRLVHGLEPTEIAHALSAPIATVKSRLQRGLARLRDALPTGLQLPAAFLVPTAALEGERDAVLSHASTKVATLTAATATATVPLAGAFLMTKLVVAAAGLAVLVYLGVTLTSDSEVRPTTAAVEASGTYAPAEASVVEAELEAPQAAETSAARAAVEADGPEARTMGSEPSDEDPAIDVAFVRGQVVDEDGVPLPDIHVLLGDQRIHPFTDINQFVRRISNTDPRELGGGADARLAITNAEGHFSLERPESNFPYLLVAWSAERGARGLTLPHENPVEIVLPVDAAVRGTVRSAADRSPIANAALHVWPETSGYPIAFEHTDRDGKYELPRLPTGKYRVSVESDGFAELDTSFGIAQRQEDHDLSVELEPLPELRVQLVDETHQRWTITRLKESLGSNLARGANWSVTVTEDSFSRHGEMDAERSRVQTMEFGAEGLVTGYVRIPEARTLAVWRGPEKVAEATLPNLLAETLVVELPERSTVLLRVRVLFDPPNDSPTPVEVSLTDPSGMSSNAAPIRSLTTTVSECALPVPMQFVGTKCGLMVESAGHAPYLGRLTVPRGESDVWHEVVLTPPDGLLTGVVVDAAGTPLANARLTLLDSAGCAYLPFRLSVRETGIDGRFSMRELPTRPMLATVVAPGQAARCFELDPTSGEDLRLELGTGRKFDLRFPDSIGAGQLRVLDDRDRPLIDDRLTGSMRYGGATLLLDRHASVVEIYDAATGTQVSRGVVPASGALEMEPVD